MVGKAPSEGTKVTAGQNAPVVREGAGAVPSESLAAQSVREGGGFAENRNINEVGSRAGAGITTQLHGSVGASAEPQGGAAPGYVGSVYARDAAGPHGKNITEDPESMFFLLLFFPVPALSRPLFFLLFEWGGCVRP